MSLTKLLIANRGEIAIRIARAAADLDIATVSVFPEDDRQSLHTRKTDEAVLLEGRGAAAYLDISQIVKVATESGCDAIHPGYGFLSENADFARACAEAGLTFVGPSPETLSQFGDKAEARALAQKCGVPVLAGTEGRTSADQAHAFMASLSGSNGGAVMVKAIAGGGGRGMRAVLSDAELDEALERCASEAKAAFGNGDVYVEQLVPHARHIEVQIIGDGSGKIVHVWERECSTQRRNQKIIEIAPAPNLPAKLRDKILSAAVQLGESVSYKSLGTIEFLVDSENLSDESNFYFIEANARLQVEHTVTEAVTGLDLVQAQLLIASGQTLEQLGLQQASIPNPRGYAIQARVNMETMAADGQVRPAGGLLSSFDPPSGPGIRVDTYGYTGYRTNPNYDSLLAKLIVHSSSDVFKKAADKTYRALSEVKTEGVATNTGFLQSILSHPSFAAGNFYTGFIDGNLSTLLATSEHRQLYFASANAAGARARAGVKVDTSDPLAVLAHGKGDETSADLSAPVEAVPVSSDIIGPDGTEPVIAQMQGTIVSLDVGAGDTVHAGQQVLVMEAMKMEHVIEAPVSGTVREITIAPEDAVYEGHPLLFIEEGEVGAQEITQVEKVDLDHIRPDLREVIDRHGKGYDENRPDAVARRRKTGQRTARENLAHLCDPGTYIEYAPLVVAAQRRRRELQDLIDRTPADGMIAGVGSVNGELFDDEQARCAILSYDYTVLAGTQGGQNHRKKDRLFDIAEQWRLPVVFFTEGGGGRPGDTDGIGGAGLDCWAFNYWGKLSGLVPMVGINSGRCFAGNAALLGCCDVVIATENSNIGMGGPAMIEGGGLGVFRPEEVGPMDVQVGNGVVDIAVKDEEEAVNVAKQYLSYFQGPIKDWTCADQRLLRTIIPENRLRMYDVRAVIETLADDGSVLELRRDFGLGMVTAFARIEGRPVGIIANNPSHLAGAIDSPGADKATRFMTLCDAFDIPLVFLCDTPGIMVGPEVEKTALVRHAARMFVNSASITVPMMTIVLRKGYGLGAQAMAGGSFKAPFFTIAWPTGEFGGMGLEGAVKLGYRKELAALEDPEERTALYEKMVNRMYEHGKAISTASYFEIDDVIDPKESRFWISRALRSVPTPPKREGKKRPCIDTW